MKTSKWSVCESGSDRTQWSVCGKTLGRKSRRRQSPRKTRWTIGGESSNQTQWSIGKYPQ